MSFDSYEVGTRCWLPDAKEGWVGAVVLSKDIVGDDSKARLLLQVQDDTSSAEPEEVERVITADPSPDLPLRNPEQLEATEDLVTLSHMNEPAVLHAIKIRYQRLSIYTFSGIVLIATNPFARVDDLYTPEVVQQYSGRQRGELEPHLFSIAEDAYRCMVRDTKSQTIVVSGESGAGKTVSAKYIMRYFASMDPDSSTTKTTSDTELSEVEREILATNPIMESFGNAKTTRNDNSSRFGKYLEIRFDAKQAIVGARIRTYLLERSRIVFHPPSERNYHIFYQMMRGLPESELNALGLSGSVSAFHYLNQGNPDIEGVDDAKDFAETVQALKVVGISEDQQSLVWKILAGLLHIGNIEIKATRSSTLVNSEDPALLKAGELLGLNTVQLAKWLTKKQITMRSEKIIRDLDLKSATTVRDSIVKFAYSALFDWLVEAVNSKLLPSDLAHELFIGVLDIYGFEHFKTNSFEQFCINYANEKLQQEFNQHVFKLEQDEYAAEEIDWTYIDFVDNQPCIALIENRMGILGLLDEESRLPAGSDEGFVNKLYSSLDGQPNFRKPRLGQSAFVVAHYAHDVEYETDGFIEKNRDTVPDQVVEVLGESTNPFLTEVLATATRSDPAAAASIGAPAVTAGGKSVAATPAGGRTIKRPTLGNIFKSSLNELMTTINATNVHYIRCIKPNENKQAWTFDGPMVLSQLRACGVLETIRISSAGFPGRWLYAEFAQRYELLLHSSQRVDSDPRKLSAEILAASGDRSHGQFQLGKTKVFLRAGMLAYLEDRRTKRQQSAAVEIQKHSRGRSVRSSYMALLAMVASLQTASRGVLARQHFQNLREVAAARRVQGVARGRAVRQDFLRTRLSIVALQTAARAKHARKTQLEEERNSAATLLQTLLRAKTAYHHHHSQVRALKTVQSMTRRRGARKELQQLREEQHSVRHMEEQQYQMENKVIELQNALSSQRDDLKSLQEKLRESESAREVALKEFAERELGLNQRHDLLHEQHVTVTRDLTSQNDRVTELEASLAESEAKRKDREEEVAQLREQIQTLQQSLATGGESRDASFAGSFRDLPQRPAQTARTHPADGSTSSAVPVQWLGDEFAEGEINRHIEQMLSEKGAKEELIDAVIKNLEVPVPKSNEKFSRRDVLFPANLINLVLSEMWRLGYVFESEKFIGMALRAIQDAVQRVKESRVITVAPFWLSNTHEIYSFLCLAEINITRTPSLREDMTIDELNQYDQLIQLAKRDSESVMFNTYHIMMKEMKKSIDKYILPAVIEEQSIPGFQIEEQTRFFSRVFSQTPQYKMDDLIMYLTKIYTNLMAFHLEESYVRQPLMELLNMVGGKTFNDLIMRKNFLTWKRAVQINYNVTRIDEWCKGHGLSVVGLPLDRLTQATKLLQLKKNYENDVSIIYDICYDLSPAQIQRLIANYKPSDYEAAITPRVHQLVSQRVLEDKDNSSVLMLDVRKENDSGPFEIASPRHLEKIEPYVPSTLNVPKLRELADATTRYSMLLERHYNNQASSEPVHSDPQADFLGLAEPAGIPQLDDPRHSHGEEDENGSVDGLGVTATAESSIVH